MYDEFESILRALSERSTAFERRIARRRADAAEARSARRTALHAETPRTATPRRVTRPEAAAPALPDFGPPTEPLTVIPQPRYTTQPLPEAGWSR